MVTMQRMALHRIAYHSFLLCERRCIQVCSPSYLPASIGNVFLNKLVLPTCSGFCTFTRQDSSNCPYGDNVGNPVPARNASGDDASVGVPNKTFGISFPLLDSPGQLCRILSLFEEHNISLTRIQNYPHPLCLNRQTIDIHFLSDDATVPLIVNRIENTLKSKVSTLSVPQVPWFPKNILDLDLFSMRTLSGNTDLSADHPGFKDKEYRKRREDIAELAACYTIGQPIPHVRYINSEIQCWSVVYEALKSLYEKHACYEYQEILDEMERSGLYSNNRIPQLQQLVNEHIHCPYLGFRLKPIPGLLNGRDFLSGLAFRVFFSTQYIRHSSYPMYTPEPDIIHELMGHAPMLANKEFADFSQIIGLASLGATDDEIKRLATCYWFSVEFGMLHQNGSLKAYGAGLLSSYGELQHSTSPTNTKIEVRAWNPYSAASQDYPITTYQPVYYASSSLDEIKQMMLEYCRNIPKPFALRFDSANDKICTDREVLTMSEV